MRLDALARIAAAEGVILLLASAAVIALRLLTGGINTRGLLWGVRRDGTRFLSPERVQLLVFVIASAGYYAALIARSPGNAALPPVPQEWIAALGGSQSLFLARKWFTFGRQAPPP